MGKTKVVELTAEQCAEFEKGHRTGKSHCFRTRCQIVLLKSEKRTSVEVAEVLGERKKAGEIFVIQIKKLNYKLFLTAH